MELSPEELMLQHALLHKGTPVDQLKERGRAQHTRTSQAMPKGLDSQNMVVSAPKWQQAWPTQTGVGGGSGCAVPLDHPSPVWVVNNYLCNLLGSFGLLHFNWELSNDFFLQQLVSTALQVVVRQVLQQRVEESEAVGMKPPNFSFQDVAATSAIEDAVADHNSDLRDALASSIQQEMIGSPPVCLRLYLFQELQISWQIHHGNQSCVKLLIGFAQKLRHGHLHKALSLVSQHIQFLDQASTHCSSGQEMMDFLAGNRARCASNSALVGNMLVTCSLADALYNMQVLQNRDKRAAATLVENYHSPCCTMT